MRLEETKLREQGRMTLPLLQKKWELERAQTCLSRRQEELRRQEARVQKLGREYVRSLQRALADEQTV